MPPRFWTTLTGILMAGGVFAATQHAGLSPAQSSTAAVTTLCAVWWLSESLPLSATSLVPFAVFPLAGVLDEKQVATAYGHPLVLLFLGGFMLSRAVEHSGAHRRLAFGILQTVGTTSDRRIVFGFMLATALISMWISNTATALMMLPVAMAVIEQDKSGKLGMPLMLGVAYAATIGGIATPIGSPPNGVCLAAYEAVTGRQISFTQWMAIGVPVSALMFVPAWLVLTFKLTGSKQICVPSSSHWTLAQRRTLAVFAIAAMGWITRDVPAGGWSELLGIEAAGDSTVALLAALSLFLISNGETPGGRLLDWETAARIPWGILLLFGGGIAIALAFESSGLSNVVGTQLADIHHWRTIWLLLAICISVTFFSEIASNTASASVMLPMLGAAATAAGLDPALLMIPAGLAVSCGFMLPVATPPNAIAYGTGRVSMAQMAKAGLLLNLIGSVVIALVCWKLVPLIFATNPVGTAAAGN